MLQGRTRQTPTAAVAASNRRAVAAVVASAVLFGTTGTTQELGPEGITPYGLGAVRVLIGALTLWVIVGHAPRLAAVRGHLPALALGGFAVAVYQPGFFTGTARLGVALGTVVALGSAPVFAGLVEWIAGRPPPRSWTWATLLAIAGGTLMVFSGAGGANFSVVGLVGSLAAGLGYAVYALTTRRLFGFGVDPTEATAWQFSIGAVLLSPFYVTEPFDWLATGSGVAAALYLGVVVTGIAYLLYGWGLRTLEASTAATFTLAEPVTAGVLAVLVLDERLKWFGWSGAVLVLVGLALAGGGARARAVAAEPPY